MFRVRQQHLNTKKCPVPCPKLKPLQTILKYIMCIKTDGVFFSSFSCHHRRRHCCVLFHPSIFVFINFTLIFPYSCCSSFFCFSFSFPRRLSICRLLSVFFSLLFLALARCFFIIALSQLLYFFFSFVLMYFLQCM